MSAVWDKLFGNFQPPANDAPEPQAEPAATQGPAAASASAPESGPKSQAVARTFDSIGRRNETLRAHLLAVEESFRDIEAIRAQFHDSLIPIDQTLNDIERTKIAHVEAERRLETLAAAHDKLKNSHSGLTLERNAMQLKQDELAARLADLERIVGAAETSSAEARAALADRTAKLERVERELEDNRRRLQTVTEQLPALRGEYAAKEKKLQEVEQQRAGLYDQSDLLTQENRALKARIEEFVTNVAKLGRKLGELESRREDLTRRVDELETALAHESTAHAKSKAAQLDAAEAQRLAQISLREELSALHVRHDAAEKLLAEARTTLREREATIRNYEQRALEHSLATKSKDAALADLEKDLSSLRGAHAEVETARLAATERSTALARALEDREAALQRTEQRIEVLEARVAEQNRVLQAEREAFEQRAARLKDQLEAESAARAFAEGALQSARHDRNGRRADGEADAAVPAHVAPAQDRVARFRV